MKDATPNTKYLIVVVCLLIIYGITYGVAMAKSLSFENVLPFTIVLNILTFFISTFLITTEQKKKSKSTYEKVIKSEIGHIVVLLIFALLPVGHLVMLKWKPNLPTLFSKSDTSNTSDTNNNVELTPHVVAV
jgi:hypothetical protein